MISTAQIVNQLDTGGVRSRAGKFLIFFLAGEEYGLEILKVREIMGMLPITQIPRTPLYIRGVINLRGKVIPVFDLRLKFGLNSKAQTEETCIIVVQVEGLDLGMIVDRVSEVLDIAERDIDDTPSFGAGIQTDYILGIGKAQGRIRLLLDINHILSTGEIGRLDSAVLQAGDENRF